MFLGTMSLKKKLLAVFNLHWKGLVNEMIKFDEMKIKKNIA